MTVTEQNELLWRTGHFRNTGDDFTDCWNVTKQDAVRLPESDLRRMLAVCSYQEWFEEDLSALTTVVHGRAAICDGVVLQATGSMLASHAGEYGGIGRCMHPDYPVDDDPDIAPLYAKAEANWPDSCRREILVGRNYDALPGLDKATTDKVYWAAQNTWTAAFSDIVLTPTNSRTRTNERMFHRLEAMSGGTLAYHYLARNRCGDWLDGAMNSNVRWTLDTGASVLTHEEYHGLGGNHTNDPRAITYPSMNQQNLGRFGRPNATDVAAVKALGYKPHPDWNERIPTGDKLFLPRGGNDPDNPDPEPPVDLESRVEANERAIFALRAEGAATRQILQYLMANR